MDVVLTLVAIDMRDGCRMCFLIMDLLKVAR